LGQTLRPRALAAARGEGSAAGSEGVSTELCSDLSRMKKPEVFLLPKDAKKTLTGKRPWRGASGCLSGSKA